MVDIHTPLPITAIRYNAEGSTRETFEAEKGFPLPDTKHTLWLNIDDVHETPFLEEYRKEFGLHPLVLEDLRSEEQRPKLEEFQDYLLVVMHMLDWNNDELEDEQLSLVIGKNILLTFQEKPGDKFDPIRKRIESGSGRVRKRGSDYLAYLLMDALFLQHIRLVEAMEEEAENLEEALLQTEQAYQLREAGTLKQIYQLRTKLSKFRQFTRPLRELITGLLETESSLIEDRTKVYLRDTYDRIRHLSDSIDNLREMLQGLIDLHMAQVNNRMSEIMKVLAMISTIFMPLNLIAAVYGMNFKFMPELEIKGFYFGVIASMVTIAACMFVFFRRKQWM